MGDALGASAAPRLAGMLRLGAAPTFLAMALLNGLPGDAPASLICADPHATWRPTGMVPMYLLMSIVHAAPWLQRGLGWQHGRIARRRGLAGAPSEQPDA